MSKPFSSSTIEPLYVDINDTVLDYLHQPSSLEHTTTDPQSSSMTELISCVCNCEETRGVRVRCSWDCPWDLSSPGGTRDDACAAIAAYTEILDRTLTTPAGPTRHRNELENERRNNE